MNRASPPSSTTIAALATAPAPAGIAVVRISGPQARAALERSFRASRDPVKSPRQLIYGKALDSKSGKVFDHCLAVYMPGPHSYTGEDVVEFHLHGSLLTVQELLRSLFSEGFLPAEPGEFTKRAYLNGKLDLIQAEAVCDLITASSEQALKLAGEQLSGHLSRVVSEVGEPLREALAEIEAGLDFPEEDIAPLSTAAVLEGLQSVRARITALLSSFSYGQQVREGYRVMLWGCPNVGKSSLLNALLGRKRAIVTDIEGTTRDLLEEPLVINGYSFIFCDGAGITEGRDRVEQIGIELAIQKIAWADLVLCLVDARNPDEDHCKMLSFLEGRAKRVWIAVNKIDLNPAVGNAAGRGAPLCRRNFFLSALTGQGLELLTQALVEEIKGSTANEADTSLVITNERHYACLQRADLHIQRAIETAADKLPVEITSIELRNALQALEALVGATADEDILGRIFSKFCIGK